MAIAALDIRETGSTRLASSRTMVANLVGLVVTLATHAWLARTLAAEAYGQFAIAMSLATVLSAIARLGWDAAVQRFVPAYQAVGNRSRLGGFLQTGTRRVWFCSTALASCLIATGALGLLPPRVAEVSLPLAALIVVQAWLLWSAACARALGRAPLAQTALEIVRPLTLLAGCGAALWLSVDASLTARDVLAIYAGATLFSGALVSFVCRRALRGGGDAPSFDELPLWRRTARPLAVGSILELAYDQADVLLVGGLLGDRVAGGYALAARLAKLPLAATTAISMTSVPRLSASIAQGNRESSRHTARQAARGMFLAASLAALIVLAGGPWALAWLGAGYAAAIGPLAILLVGRCAAAAYGPAMQALPLVGHARRVPLYLAIGLAIQAIFSLIAIPWGGAIGAAIVRCAAAITCGRLAHSVFLGALCELLAEPASPGRDDNARLGKRRSGPSTRANLVRPLRHTPVAAQPIGSRTIR
ncbi:MAG: lipopolysaccharide biosynthesis protein [Pirellulales bacterium]